MCDESMEYTWAVRGEWRGAVLLVCREVGRQGIETEVVGGRSDVDQLWKVGMPIIMPG